MKRNKKIIKGFASAAVFSLAGLFFLIFIFWIAEPGIVGAATDSDSVNVNLAVTGTISLNSPVDVTMSPDIAGTGTSTGSADWTVTTNNSTGYKLEVATNRVNTMQSAASDIFTDYTEGTPGTPEVWSVAANASEFGFNASGTAAEAVFSGSKYEGFKNTTKVQVAHESVQTVGTSTSINFKAEVGSSKFQPTGSYSAIVTATATTL
jgi:hypothetical protein